MLENDGAFEDRCKDNDELPCDQQSVILVQIQLIATSMAVFSPLLGIFGDRYGPLALMYFVSFCGSLGIALAIVASSTSTEQLYYVSFSFTGLMFVGTIILMVQTGMVFPDNVHRRRVITLLNVLFDAGTITYLLLYQLSDSTGASFIQVMGGYLGIGFVCFGGSIFFWITIVKQQGLAKPDPCVAATATATATAIRSKSTTKSILSLTNNLLAVHDRNLDQSIHLEQSQSHGDASAGSSAMPENTLTREGGETTSSPKNNLIDQGKSRDTNRGLIDSSCSGDVIPEHSSYSLISQREPWQQLRSKQFLLVVIFFCIHVSKNNWVMATARHFLRSLGDDQKGNFYTSLFTGLSSASIVGLPFMDVLVTKYGYYGALQTINILALVHCIIQVSSTNLNVQVLGFVFYSFYRCFTFAVSYSFLPTFLSGTTVGRGCGLMSFYSAIFSLVNMGLSTWSINGLDSNFFIPNLLFLFVIVPVLFITRLIGTCIRQEERKRKEVQKARGPKL